MQYKRTIISGIYKIRNKIDNKIYIGSSEDYLKRLWNHKSELRTNVHSNIYLQRAFNKYKEENFEFLLIEECNKEDLIKREIYYSDLYNTLKKKYGYNLRPIEYRKGNYQFVSRKNSIILQKFRGNFKKFKLINKVTLEEFEFTNLYDASKYIKSLNNKSPESIIKKLISMCLRGTPHWSNNKPLKSVYKHYCKIIE